MNPKGKRRLEIAGKFLQLQTGRDPLPVIKSLSPEGQAYLKELVDFVDEYETKFGENTWFQVKTLPTLK